jgi:hypothetical protein
MSLLRRYLPILTWGSEYSSRTFINDLIVEGIVTVMLMPGPDNREESDKERRDESNHGRAKDTG